MKFVTLSDLHGNVDFLRDLEYFNGTFIVAGDLHEVKKTLHYKEMVSVLCSKAEYVVLVPGNHEYYSGNIESTNRKLKEMEVEFENLFVLLNEMVYIDGVAIIGSTLWTDFDNGNPLTLLDASIKMNDYKHIRFGPVGFGWKQKLKPHDVQNFHYKAKDYIAKQIEELYNTNPDQKIIVVTHHSPSFSSTPNKYLHDSLNGCYSSNMDNYVGMCNPDFWIHGHIHDNSDYMIGDTRIICNPHGYNVTENPHFDIQVVYEL